MIDKPIQTAANCEDPREQKALPFNDALAAVLNQCRPVTGHESVDITDALGRMLAKTVTSSFDVPAFANSAMDGYAVAAADLPVSGSRAFRLDGKSLAGTIFSGTLSKGGCIRITTGAVMPDGADTVIMQEHVEQIDEHTIRIDDRHRPKQHVRNAGDDIAAGSKVIESGRYLNAADLGVLASLGISSVEVFRKPEVLFFSSGDEIKPLGQPLAAGEIYNSSRYSIGALITQSGAKLTGVGLLKDDYNSVKTELQKAAKSADIIITTGGVSVGEADYIKGVLADIGEIGFWKIAMKPGRPLAFGSIGSCTFFGLPGNPVSSMATFMQLVQPAIQRIAGRDPLPSKVRLSALATSPIKKKPGRIDFQRGILSRQNGAYEVVTTGAQGSGKLSSMSMANCFIILAAEDGDVEVGDEVTVEPFENVY